jgi:serine/threonine protein kinase
LTKKEKINDDNNFKELNEIKQDFIYEVKDVEAELEMLTEDEDEISLKPLYEREIWEIKKNIKLSFKKDLKAPDTDFDYYKVGKIIGKGASGKVNLGLHKLTRKVVAMKSVKIDSMNKDISMKRVTNEFDILASLRHKNIV